MLKEWYETIDVSIFYPVETIEIALFHLLLLSKANENLFYENFMKIAAVIFGL